MRMGLAQMDMVWEDKTRNFQKSLRFLDEAGERGAELVLFPEMSMTGFSMHPERIAEEKESLQTLDFFREQAVRRSLFIGVGYVRKGGGSGGEQRAENRYAILGPDGRVLADYAKIHPFSYGQEAGHYRGGEELVTCQVQEFCTAPLICYDLRFPEVFQILSRTAQLILVPANWPLARQEHYELLIRARALENQCYVAGVNRTGEGGGLLYGGGSLIADPFGEVLVRADGKEQLLTADLTVDLCRQYRVDFPVKKDRREELYVVLSKKNV